MTRQSKTERYPLVLPVLASIARDACSEYRFHPDRKWRADFAIPSAKILIEIDGGVWSGGRHTRGAGFLGDMEKLTSAAVLGYRVLRYAPKDCNAKNVSRILNDVAEAMRNGK